MSEKSQYHIPSPNERGTELQPGDTLSFTAANPSLEPLNVVMLNREAKNAAVNTVETQEIVIAPQDAMLTLGNVLAEARNDELHSKLDTKHDDDAASLAFINAMHKERAEQLTKKDAA